MTTKVGSPCPVPNAHRRLDECHRLWHRVADAYDDPDEFRTNLNALLQALRNITFVLQKEKLSVPDFDNWYEGWRKTLAEDGVLRWLIEARNHVVKEGDLETLSTARAGIQASWEEPEITTFTVPPLMPTVVIAGNVNTRDIPMEVREGGLLLVERRWVAKSLPAWELLDALAHCYGLLSYLITDAHRQAGSLMHTIDVTGETPQVLSSEINGGRLPCMVATEDMRTVLVNLRTGEIFQSGTILAPRDDEATRLAIKRYGREPAVAPPDSRDPLDWARFYLEQAKLVLSRDKWHAEYAFLFHPEGPRSIISAVPSDQQDKYVFMNDVANEIRRFGVTGLVLVADAWIALKGELPPHTRPSELKSRSEALMVTAARSDGATRVLTTPYKRRFGRIVFDETEESVGEHFYLAPILRAWGLPVPSEREAGQEIERLWHEAQAKKRK